MGDITTWKYIIQLQMFEGCEKLNTYTSCQRHARDINTHVIKDRLQLLNYLLGTRKSRLYNHRPKESNDGERNGDSQSQTHFCEEIISVPD